MKLYKNDYAASSRKYYNSTAASCFNSTATNSSFYSYLQTSPYSNYPDNLHLKYHGAKDQETQGEIKIIRKGDTISLRDLLFTKDRDYLVRYNGDQQVKAAHLAGKDGRVVRKSLTLGFDDSDFPFLSDTMEQEAFRELDRSFFWGPYDQFHWGLRINSHCINEKLGYIYRSDIYDEDMGMRREMGRGKIEIAKIENANSSMEQTLARYNKRVESSENSAVEQEVPKEVREVECLKQELADLKLKNMQLLGEDLSGLGLKELQQLEQLLNEGLLSVKDKNEEYLLEQLELSRKKEELLLEQLSRQKPNALPDLMSGYLEHEVPRNEYEVMTNLYLGPSPPPDNVQRKRKTLERETETPSGTSDRQIE
ncbi:hypothetical protein POM88_053799 [Heracleum sosnowskyi]|uniref:K-box domain-containing protein n=1 Tax=Heracleum sosnowskyi TaxID=360622 RepID=A0AAD8GNH8_9APIA|nr:hypothetical protein POM88_053799 [Heracleum sosnowskyi]